MVNPLADNEKEMRAILDAHGRCVYRDYSVRVALDPHPLRPSELRYQVTVWDIRESKYCRISPKHFETRPAAIDRAAEYTSIMISATRQEV